MRQIEKYPKFILLFFIMSCSSLALSQSITYLLAGAVSQEGVTLAFRSTLPGKHILRIGPATDTTWQKEQQFTPDKENNYIQKWAVNGLEPNTQYRYELKHLISGVARQGQFTTFPVKPSSFRYCFGSCMETGSESDIFDHIRLQKPLFFLQGGDLHYEDIDSNCEVRFQEAYQRVFSSKRQGELYSSVPLVYIWDDHDFGPNNADSSNPCKKESTRTYDSHIPHYALDLNKGEGPISQVFDAGRITFVLTDLRSQKVRPVYDGCNMVSKGTNFGSEEHLNWFFKTLTEARDRGQVVAWYNSYPWINAPGGPNYKCAEKDNWGGYPEERERIANFIRDQRIPLFIMSGDAHMVAMDNGTNSDYATGGGAPIRVFQAAAIDRPGSYKGGPYSQGYSRESGQFGIVEVIDQGGREICFSWYGINKAGQPVRNQEGEEIRLQFCLPVPNK